MPSTPLPSTFLLIALLVLILAALASTAVVVGRRQRALLRQREALQKQRGAGHIREIAMAAYGHTGRADLAVILLQLSTELLEEATHLAPREPAVTDSLQQLRSLINQIQVDDRPPRPLANPASVAELTQACMQLTEATRLLRRLEARAEMNRDDLACMETDLERVRQLLEQRLKLRRELETAAELVPAVDDSGPEPARLGPTPR